MSDAPPTPPPADDARAVLNAARGWLAEWVEEGVVSFPAARANPNPGAADSVRDAAPPPYAAPARQTSPASTSAPEAAHEPHAAPALQTPLASTSAPAAAHEPHDASASAPAPATTPASPPPRAGDLFPITQGAPPSLDDVRAELGECTRCGLCEGRTKIVFGDGNPSAALMFIGEGPGAEEDARGLPFVGRAGELLTKMIEAGLGIARAEVYICNIVKCRPPGNRDPQPDEVARCRPFLDGQIAALRPRVIVTLGKPATSALLGRTVAITRVRGTWHEYRGIPVMPTFHPAFVLRRYTKETRQLVWQDLKAAHERSQR